VGLAACSTYDTGLLESGEAMQLGSPRAGSPADGDGGRLPARPDTDVDECGDGEVALSERCDIAIAAGTPGSCPTSCPPLADCIARALDGSDCQAQCVVLAQSCADGDGCCPAGCSDANDEDCSQRCGDGSVQLSEGETCEPGSRPHACPTEADCDDRNPCTADVLAGSAENCNASCSHAEVTSLVSGDGCCPARADANGDGDCISRCGNGVREPGEECDGGLGCDGQCALKLTMEQVACLEQIDETGNECDRCTCTQCAPVRLGCVDSGEATRDMHCAAIIQCANDNDCASTACYCADAYCRTAGPCHDVINAAVASDPSGESVAEQDDDPETAVGRAVLVGDCKAAYCSHVCP
jgi:hypothetical protein